jgi:MoaA/NifB/PqqE/SkfB family radical SAM enzyme
MQTSEVFSLLDEARDRGVKEYYFTGGEPFLHDDIEALIERTLAQGPLSILTNALLIDADRAVRLAKLAAASPYSLDLRVSIDGITAAENDPIRGRGSFDKILEGATYLVQAGLSPVFTVTTVHAQYDRDDGRRQFLDALTERGFERARAKFIPPFHIGREELRGGEYAADFSLHPDQDLGDAASDLQCAGCRTVSANGVYPCPILIEEDGARMGRQLEDGLGPIELNHPACATCVLEGFTCRT